MTHRLIAPMVPLLSAALLMAPAHASKPARSADPLAGYYGNTMICAAGQRGNDLCHIWLEKDGSMVNIDPSGIHKGHFTRGPARPDGKVPICLYYETSNMVIPAEAMVPPPGSAAMPPREKMPGGVICTIRDYRSTCTIHESEAGLDEQQKAKMRLSIVARFHEGMCYPLPAAHPGETWFEEDDPMPSQNGIDKVFLVKGRR